MKETIMANEDFDASDETCKSAVRAGNAEEEGIPPLWLTLDDAEARVDSLLDVITRAVLFDEYELDRNAMATVLGMLDQEQKTMRRLFAQYAEKPSNPSSI
jgi:hypothetical protein